MALEITFRPRKRWPRWVAIGLLLATVTVVIFFWWTHKDNRPQIVKQQSTEQQSTPYITKLSSNLLFTGNVYWGRYINDWSQASDLKTAYPFSRLKEFNRDSYQTWIGGLECPLVEGVNLTSAQEEATLSFNCSPDYLPEAAKWFDVFSLANNHTDNQGIDGFTETQQHLEKAGIQYFGHYDPRSLEDICEVIGIDVVATNSDATTSISKLPIALCGYHGVFRIPTEESLAIIERYSKIMPVVAMPHAGAEYKAEPDTLKTQLYRSMIDHGADIVIGDHPHWIQTTESYKGRLIVYSMGNFIFDQQFNREVTRSAAIRTVLTATGDREALSAWTKLAESCLSYHDSCLEEAERQSLSKLDISYQYQAIGSSNQNRLAHPADNQEQQEILQRLRWDQTMSQLKQPHSKLP